MDELLPLLYTRLMAQEFLIEFMFARWLVSATEETSEEIKRYLINIEPILPLRPGPVDAEQLEAQKKAVKADVQEILRTISCREARLRELAARGR